jgi:hypothetical protein
MTDDIWADEIRWTLSQVRQCVPEQTRPRVPDRFDAESLLIQDLAETEFTRDEWMRIAHSWRELAETALEATAVLEDQNRKLRALAKNMGEELMLRKPQ